MPPFAARPGGTEKAWAAAWPGCEGASLWVDTGWSIASRERSGSEATRPGPPRGGRSLGGLRLLLTEDVPDCSSGTWAEPPASEPGRVSPGPTVLIAGVGVMLQDDVVTTLRRPVVVLNALGLHFRPADRFVGLAKRFSAEIRVHRDVLCVDGKSILDLAMLAAGCGTRLELEARGPDAEGALAALADLVRARFHEGDEAE